MGGGEETGTTDAGDCCEPNGSPGCNDAALQTCTCTLDSAPKARESEPVSADCSCCESSSVWSWNSV